MRNVSMGSSRAEEVVGREREKRERWPEEKQGRS
jgi:hypothetical protein